MDQVIDVAAEANDDNKRMSAPPIETADSPPAQAVAANVQAAYSCLYKLIKLNRFGCLLQRRQ